MPPSQEILCPNFLEMQKRRQVFNASSHILSQHDNVYCIQYGSVSFLTLEAINWCNFVSINVCFKTAVMYHYCIL